MIVPFEASQAPCLEAVLIIQDIIFREMACWEADQGSPQISLNFVD